VPLMVALLYAAGIKDAAEKIDTRYPRRSPRQQRSDRPWPRMSPTLGAGMHTTNPCTVARSRACPPELAVSGEPQRRARRA